MKRILLLATVLLLVAAAHAQSGNTLTIRFAGVPSGTCAPFFLGVNNATSDEYNCTSGGAWNKISGGGGAGTVTNAGNNLTSGRVVLGNGSPDVTTSANLNFSTATLTIGAAGASGVLGLAGTTSGTATLTAPAVAGTSTNPITSTNVLLAPVGSVGAPSYGNASSTNSGMFFISDATILASNGNSVWLAQNTTSAARAGSGIVIGWSSNTNASSAVTDTGMSRSAAGVIAFGNATASNTTSKLKASGYISVGTKFTTNNGCTDSATAGGATAGTFTVGSASCTEVVTMGDTATAPNGWSCTVVDITTLADVTNPHQTTSNATTATFVTGTVVSGDQIQFSCIGY